MGTSAQPSPAVEGRLTSLDFFRGVMMFMLVGEATGLYELPRDPALNGTPLNAIGTQLDHRQVGRRVLELAIKYVFEAA
jgi:hypothetical protein